MSAAFSGVIKSSNEVNRNNLIKRFTVKVLWSDATHISYACVIDKNIYFACDTSLFSDMQLIGKSGVDVAVLPIGDLFTMGPEDSLEAIRLIQPRQVLPSHYGTWPPIEQDAEAWATLVREETDAEPIVLSPGGRHTL